VPRAARRDRALRPRPCGRILAPRGRQALDDAGDRVAQIEEHWSQIAGPERFASTCRTLQDLLDTLTRRTDGA